MIVPQLKLWFMGGSSDDPPARGRAVHDKHALSSISGDDQTVLDRLRAGDVASFEAIYLEHAPRLWQFAYRYVRTAADAEDVVQDVFQTLWNSRSVIEIHSSITAYLYGAVRFRAFRVRRDRLRDVDATGQLEHTFGSAGGAPDAAVESADFDEAVRRVMGRVRPPARDVLYLRWAHAMSYDDIAAALGISAASARQHVHRMLQKLGPAFRRLLAE